MSFSEAMDRAKARANTLSKLESAYGTTNKANSAFNNAKLSSSTTSNSNNNKDKGNSSKKPNTNNNNKVSDINSNNTKHKDQSKINNNTNKNVSNTNNNNINKNKVSISSTVEILTKAIGDASEKTKKRLHDALRGKSIVLENNNSNTNNTNKLININKMRSRKQQRSSKRYLKKNSLCDNFYIPTVEAMNVLHQMWVGYIKGVMQLCQSNAEMQAKLYISEMIGAKIVVLDTYKTSPIASLNGITGIVTSESSNCYYLSIYNDNDDKRKVSSKSTINNENDIKVIRIIKENHIIGVLLPNIPKRHKNNNPSNNNSTNTQRDDHVAILYGKKFMPYAK